MARRFEDARIVPTGEMPAPDISMIPASVARVIGQTVFEAVQLAFQDPAVQEDYKRWKAARDAKEVIA